MKTGFNSYTTPAGLPERGMLRHFGYRVGVGARSLAFRCIALKSCFIEDDLPRIHSQKYVEEWGDPRSAKRLEKIATTIAALCRNDKRKGPMMKTAISDRELDLEWLKTRFYDGQFDFDWPSTLTL